MSRLTLNYTGHRTLSPETTLKLQLGGGSAWPSWNRRSHGSTCSWDQDTYIIYTTKIATVNSGRLWRRLGSDPGQCADNHPQLQFRTLYTAMATAQDGIRGLYGVWAKLITIQKEGHPGQVAGDRLSDLQVTTELYLLDGPSWWLIKTKGCITTDGKSDGIVEPVHHVALLTSRYVVPCSTDLEIWKYRKNPTCSVQSTRRRYLKREVSSESRYQVLCSPYSDKWCRIAHGGCAFFPAYIWERQ